MRSIVYLIIIVLIIICIVKIFRNDFHFTFDTFTHFQGSLGSGKTTLLVFFARVWKKTQHFKNQVIKILNKIFFNKIPYVCEVVYSNFPIYFGRKLGWSLICDKGIFLWEYEVEDGCLVVFDELSNAFPNVRCNTAVMADDLERFTLTWSRHAFNFTAYTACQSLSSVDKNLRQKMQHCYTLFGHKHGWFRSRVNVIESFNSEDVHTVYETSNKDVKDNVFKFRNVNKYFDSRYGKQFYSMDRDLLRYIASNTDKLLLLFKKKPKESWDSFEYNVCFNSLKDFLVYENKQNNKKVA